MPTQQVIYKERAIEGELIDPKGGLVKKRILTWKPQPGDILTPREEGGFEQVKLLGWRLPIFYVERPVRVPARVTSRRSRTDLLLED